jgi:hypothetical protein
MRSPVLLTFAFLAPGLLCWAEEPKKTAGARPKASAPKLDLGLPKFDSLPSQEKLAKPTAPPEPEAKAPGAQGRVDESGPALVSVVHRKGRGASAPLSQVAVSGNPLTTEAFSTAVRVRSPSRRSSSVELTVLDSRETTVMEARGLLVFRNSDEAEWAVDWAPTAVRAAGEFRVQVSVGGTVLATEPIKFAETTK